MKRSTHRPSSLDGLALYGLAIVGLYVFGYMLRRATGGFIVLGFAVVGAEGTFTVWEDLYFPLIYIEQYIRYLFALNA